MARKERVLLSVFLLVAGLWPTSRMVDPQGRTGRMTPLGRHQPPSEGVTSTGNFPKPLVFYNHFVHPGTPLLMRNVLQNVSFAAFEKWTDDYLSLKYARLKVRVEQGKKESRSKKSKYMSLKSFLDSYKKEDIYLVQSIPEKMKDEVILPQSLQCTEFEKAFRDAVVWLSDGGTRSVLHYDGMDNLNCMLAGKKEVILIDKKHKHLVEADGFLQEGTYSTVDVDAVDFDRFPKLIKAPWMQTWLQKGDCIYIPYRWYHHLRATNDRNLAINFWFSHLWWLNQTACQTTREIPEVKLLSQVTMLSQNEEVRSKFLAAFAGKKEVVKAEFLKELDFLSNKEREEIFKLADRNANEVLTWQELYSFDIEKLMWARQTSGIIKDWPASQVDKEKNRNFEEKAEKISTGSNKKTEL